MNIRLLLNPARAIPSQYMAEFTEKWIQLIRSRVQLFCALAIGVNVLASSLSFIFYPEEFNPREIPLWILILAGAGIVLYINRKTRTITSAKLVAYAFTILLLIIIKKSLIIYHDQAEMAGPIYMYILFLVAFTIPWTPLEILPITGMHLLSFGMIFLYFRTHFEGVAEFGFDMRMLYDGIIFLSIGFMFCFVVRAKEMARDVENFLLFKETEEQKKQMQKELELATRVHNTLIPKSLSTDKVDIAVTYLPMQYIGGDYTKFHFLSDDKLMFIICDVTGHGVSAALLVNRFHAEFERLAKEGKSPGVLLQELNNFIVEDFEGTNMFLSAFCCLLDFSAKKLVYSNHGHPPQYIYRVTESQIQYLEPQASLMGIFPGNDGVHQHDTPFENGDRILLFTDGVVEARTSAGELFGAERLESFISEKSSLAVDLFNKELIEALNTFKNGPFEDDVLVVNVKVK